MFNKSIIPALMTATTLIAGFAPTATFASGVVIPEGRGTRAELRDHRTPQPEVRDHRTPQTETRDHRTPRRNEVVVVGQGRFDCVSGGIQLHRMGYHDIVASDCSGAVFHYTAMDGSAIFHAAMSSHSGSMRVEFVGIAN